MKKILLGTTGLVGAALLASAASAETPKVTLGGFSDFQAGITDQDRDSASDPRSGTFRNDNEVSIHVDGKTDGGLGYGAVIDLEADTTNDADNQGTNASRTFTYLEGAWGRTELGGNKSVAATQRIDASTVAVATGGINGAWTYFAAAPSNNANFISSSKLAVEHGRFDAYADESTYNATKINYYTPVFSGLQAGVSYTPDTESRGQTVATRDQVGYSDVWDFGLTYNTQIDSNWKLGLSGTYETASVDQGSSVHDNYNGWNIGGLIGYQSFSLAGSYGKLDGAALYTADNTAANGATNGGRYWTAGLGYEAGPVGLSATYLDSSLHTAGGRNDFTNVVFGADYKLAPGLTPYAEVSLFDADAVGTTNDNQGTAVILGTQIAF